MFSVLIKACQGALRTSDVRHHQTPSGVALHWHLASRWYVTKMILQYTLA